MTTPLLDLSPRWWSAAGRHGQGIRFDCPHCGRFLIAVGFRNPLDGGEPYVDPDRPDRPLWHRIGETFETLTLSPSIDTTKAGHWHGFLIDGALT